MSNELTQEQAEELKKFNELPAEKKAEIIESQCIFCQISKNKIETIKIFEDEDVVAVLDINPANTGHVLIFPKKHFQFLFQLSPRDKSKIFDLASKLSMIVVNTVKATGFNIHVANGGSAGQRVPHFVLNLIPRFDDDGIKFLWEPKKIEKEELEKIALELKNQLLQEAKEKEETKQLAKKSISELEHELNRFKRIA